MRAPLVVWAIWGVVWAATWATNGRIPPAELWGVTGHGFAAGASRALVFLGWPISLAAVGLLLLAVDRLLAGAPSPLPRGAVLGLAVASVVLCATIVLPGVSDSNHLDAKWSNVPAALGVAIALGLTLAALRVPARRPPPLWRIDPLLIAALVAMLLAAVPWLFANLGIYVGDVPGLHAVFMSKKIVPEAGHPHLRAVHLGNHEGLDGILLMVTGVVIAHHLPQLHGPRLRTVTAAYASVLVVYGLAVALGDFWNEQVFKRGWASGRFPGVIRPSAGLPWAGIALASIALALLVLRWLGRRGEPAAGLGQASAGSA